MNLRALVIRTAGTNCDAEMCVGLTRAGAAAELVHVDALAADPARLEAYHLIGFPGGFSHGDDIAAGRILAVKLRERLYPALRASAMRGVPMIGACNGFQAMVQVGLLPGPAPGAPWPEEAPPRQRLALVDNVTGRFSDRWVPIRFEPSSVCVWTRDIAVDMEAMPAADRADVSILPVAHGEGRLVADAPDLIPTLEAAGQIVFRYEDNYNGSEGAIGGVCDASGRIFGLMPHPERYLEWTRHPYWTRLSESLRRGETPGLRMFRNAVEAARCAPAARY